MEKDLLQGNPQEQEPISGWLAFFLWVGVDLGAIVSCISTLAELRGFGWTPLSFMIITGMMGSLVAIAILTNVAFYKRQPNAVSLAITYVAMVALDAVMQCVLGIILDDDSFFKGTFRSLIWAVVWFSYLKQSKKVKRVIPEETRCWKVTEIILLIVFFLSSVAFCTAMNNFTKDPTNSHLMSKEYLIKQAIEEMNKTLPSDIDGILLENAELQGLMVVYNYKFPNNSVTEIDLGYIKKNSIAHKQEILQGFATETDKELISFYELIFDNGYDLCYYFKDKNDQLIYSVVTTIADYHRAVECGNNYRCDRNAWSEVIKQTNNDLPTQYMGDGTLTNVSVDFERNVVTYEVELPELEDYLLRFAMTEEHLEDYIMRNLGDLSDYIWTMAGIDKMSLKYHFVTSMGIDHATVTIPYESFKSQI